MNNYFKELKVLFIATSLAIIATYSSLSIDFSYSFKILQGDAKMWLALYQRLLGPSIALTLDALGVSSKTYSIGIIFTTYLLQYGLIYYFLNQHITHIKALVWTCLLCCIHLVYPPYQIWDFFDGIIFVVFAYAMFEGKSKKFFLILFIVAILNRESALFIPLYFIFKSISLNQKIFIDKDNFCFGSILLIGGILFTLGLRFIMLVYNDWSASVPTYHIGGTHLNLKMNLSQFVSHLFTPETWCGARRNIPVTTSCIAKNFFKPLLLTIMIMVSLLILRGNELKKKNIALIMITMIVSIFCFANFTEARTYIMLYPMFIFMVTTTRKPQ